jgi:hypothetical protein
MPPTSIWSSAVSCASRLRSANGRSSLMRIVTQPGAGPVPPPGTGQRPSERRAGPWAPATSLSSSTVVVPPSNLSGAISPRSRCPSFGSALKQPVDLRPLNGSSFDPTASAIPWRRLALGRGADRVAMQPGAAMDLPLRPPARGRAAAAPPRTAPRRPPGSSQPRSAQTNPGNPDHRTITWPIFTRLRRPSFHPAPTPPNLFAPRGLRESTWRHG